MRGPSTGQYKRIDPRCLSLRLRLAHAHDLVPLSPLPPNSINSCTNGLSPFRKKTAKRISIACSRWSTSSSPLSISSKRTLLSLTRIRSWGPPGRKEREEKSTARQSSGAVCHMAVNFVWNSVGQPPAWPLGFARSDTPSIYTPGSPTRLARSSKRGSFRTEAKPGSTKSVTSHQERSRYAVSRHSNAFSSSPTVR